MELEPIGRAGLSRDERGATAVEYGLMVALIAVAILGAVTLIGTNMQSMFSSIAALV
jgi:pilus assembly protein Flp/PilA